MFNKQFGNNTLEMNRWNLDEMFWHGQGPDLMIAIGCSWTRAWGRKSSEHFFRTPQWQEDTDFMINGSYVGRVAQYLGFDSFVNMAIPGSNNQTQVLNLMDFVKRNRKYFRRVFVLWGITSVHRWELWCSRRDSIWSYMYAPNLDREEMSEWSYHFKNHWDEEYEKQKLADSISMCSAWLTSQDIEHLFFPVFQPYNKINMLLSDMSDRHLFGANTENNDMLSLICQQSGQDAIASFLGSPNTSDNRVSNLVLQGWLSTKHEHPTDRAHEFIAQQLIMHLEKYK